MYDVETRRRITRAAIHLAAGKNANMQNHAFRLLVGQYRIQANHAEIEAELAQMRADALRELEALVTTPELG